MTERLLRLLHWVLLATNDDRSSLDSVISECLTEVCVVFGWKAATASFGTVRRETGDSAGLIQVHEVPLMAGTHRVGTLTFYGETSSPVSVDGRRVIQSIGLQLGRMVERVMSRGVPGRVAEPAHSGAAMAVRTLNALSAARGELENSEVELRLFREVNCGTRACLGAYESHFEAIVFAIDRDGNFIHFAGKGLEALGIRPERFVGRSAFDICRKFPWVIESVRRTLQGEEVRSSGCFLDRWYDTVYVPLRGSQGEVSGIVGSAIDVSARHQAQEALRRLHQEQSNLVAALEDAVEGIAKLDPEGRYQSVNAAYLRISGQASENLIGRSWKETIAPDDHPAMLQALEQARAHGKARIEVRGIRPNGEVYFKQVILRACLDSEGELSGLYKFSKDVTEERDLRLRLVHADRMAAVGALAAGVAHEINNPLTYVLTNLGLACETLRGQVSQDVYALLSGACDGADRLRGIVRSLRVFSRMEEETPGSVDVHQAIENAINIASNEIRSRATLVRSYGQAPIVYGSEGRLCQVILNLLINAAQAIPEGDTERNRIEILTGVEESGRVFIEISDTGSGIPAKDLPKIFDPFFTTKPAGIGTGLGLSVCRGIITGFGGDILVASTEGVGTRFRILLRAAGQQCAAIPVIESGAAAREPKTGRRGRVLIIDDEAMIGKALEKALSCEHEVIFVQGGREGLERLCADSAFDIVLCDLIMPGMTGMDLYERACQRSPELGSRFVFMTGGAYTPRSQEFVERMGRPRLEKPFELSSVRSLVARMVCSAAVS